MATATRRVRFRDASVRRADLDLVRGALRERVAPLLPHPAPLPRHAGPVLLALVVSACVVGGPGALAPGAFPGDPALSDGPVTLNLHARAHDAGLAGWIADDHLGFPARTDRAALRGAPIAAATSAPFTAVLGWEGGMRAWALTVAWAVGAGAALLAMRGWGSAAAGLVAGVAMQVSEPIARAWAEGRADEVLAAALLAPALGLGWRAGVSGRARWAVAAGGLAAAAAMIEPGTGVGTALAGLVPLGLGGALSGAAEARRAFVARIAAWAAGAAVVGGFPLAWLVASRHASPSFGADPWQPIALGLSAARPVDLAVARIFGDGGLLVGTLGRPALLVAVVLGVWRAGVRRGPLSPSAARAWAVPVAVGALSAIGALGSYLPGPVALPWGLAQRLPLFSRAWAPDALWAGVALSLALLAAGAADGCKGPQRQRKIAGAVTRLALSRGALAALLVAALLGEAFALSGSLPLPALSLRRSQTADALAVAPDVPLVLLPVPGGPFRPDRLDLLDQVHHGRAMAADLTGPLDLRGADGVLRVWQENRGLRALLACELDRGSADAITPADATHDLRAAGLREVWLDPRYVQAASVPLDPRGAATLGCVERLLAGWSRSAEGPLVRWQAL